MGHYLIERHGAEKFFRIYDRPLELMDFEGLYGKPAQGVIDDWL